MQIVCVKLKIGEKMICSVSQDKSKIVDNQIQRKRQKNVLYKVIYKNTRSGLFFVGKIIVK